MICRGSRSHSRKGQGGASQMLNHYGVLLLAMWGEPWASSRLSGTATTCGAAAANGSWASYSNASATPQCDVETNYRLVPQGTPGRLHTGSVQLREVMDVSKPISIHMSSQKAARSHKSVAKIQQRYNLEGFYFSFSARKQHFEMDCLRSLTFPSLWEQSHKIKQPIKCLGLRQYAECPPEVNRPYRTLTSDFG